MRRLMHLLARWVDPVSLFRRAGTVQRALPRSGRVRLPDGSKWPPEAGAYNLGDPNGHVAACTLSSTDLAPILAAFPDVAIAGRLYTANLGIERLVRNIVANPSIRALVLCGHESALFRPAQTLTALVANGTDEHRHVIGALGHLPTLTGISNDTIHAFRQQISVIDLTGETAPDIIRQRIAAIPAANPPATVPPPTGLSPKFTELRAGGRRRPFRADDNGYFVIEIDREASQIILRHYTNDNQPAHQIRDARATRIAAAVVDAGLISQLSHASYLAHELTKAEVALRLGHPYEQDQPLGKQLSTRLPVTPSNP